jgi:hypothetical protein
MIVLHELEVEARLLKDLLIVSFRKETAMIVQFAGRHHFDPGKRRIFHKHC